MPASVWYEGESLKQLLQGAALGAFATLGIGFSWGGFMLGSTAKTLADSTASSAVVAAIRRSASISSNTAPTPPTT